jgi:hypothetical protein
MKMRGGYHYTLHNELADCSLSGDFAGYSNKREALRIARKLAKDTEPLGATAIVVMDSVADVAVGVFPTRIARILAAAHARS